MGPSNREPNVDKAAHLRDLRMREQMQRDRAVSAGGHEEGTETEPSTMPGKRLTVRVPLHAEDATGSGVRVGRHADSNVSDALEGKRT